jgi:hypothetical protein
MVEWMFVLGVLALLFGPILYDQLREAAPEPRPERQEATTRPPGRQAVARQPVAKELGPWPKQNRTRVLEMAKRRRPEESTSERVARERTSRLRA